MKDSLVSGLLGFFGGAAQGAHEKIAIDSERTHQFTLEEVRRRNTLELEEFRNNYDREVRQKEREAEALRYARGVGDTLSAEGRAKTREEELYLRGRQDSATDRDELRAYEKGQKEEERALDTKKERFKSLHDRAVQELDKAESIITEIASVHMPDALQDQLYNNRLGAGGAESVRDQHLRAAMQNSGANPRFNSAPGGADLNQFYLDGGGATAPETSASSTGSTIVSAKGENTRPAMRVQEMIRNSYSQYESQGVDTSGIKSAANLVDSKYEEIQQLRNELAGYTVDDLDAIDVRKYSAAIASLKDAVRTWGAELRRAEQAAKAQPKP